VWERTVGRDDLVPPELLLETMRGLGYTATELGPPGYFTPQLLERHEMALVGGFAPLRFEDESAFRDDMEIEKAIVSALDKDERDQLATLLEKLARAMEDAQQD